ncbi:MAG: hypothetical protein B6I38_03290 [Anaerolineaceae bacterium 4572_5.1]|nr:MAG: hypothetical protein B6I38_03290 [Anaerolineaceae bacterium 4572_5.1]RLD06254.1 MAG: hypothetical protein DRI56_08335 [Chloroflexota bacterium]
MGTILFIDDNLDTLVLYQKAATIVGHKAIIAASGEEALTTVIDILPDLIVLDLNLPDMSGLTLIEQMRAKESMRDVPIIMLSASYPGEAADKAISSGANAFLSKPISLEAFFAVIDKYL